MNSMRNKEATIHRMVTPKHLCPWGIKALDLLKRHGFKVDDHHIGSQEANEAYKEESGYDETPQVWIVRSPDVFGEAEVLRLGPVRGATPIILVAP